MTLLIDIPCDLLLKVFQLIDRKSKISLILIDKIIYSRIQNHLMISAHSDREESHANYDPGRKGAFKYLETLAKSKKAILDYLTHDNIPSHHESLTNRHLIANIKPKSYYRFLSFFSKKTQIISSSDKRNRFKSYYLLKWIVHTDDIFDLIILLYNVSNKINDLQRRLLPIMAEGLSIHAENITRMEIVIELFTRDFLLKDNSVDVVALPNIHQIKIDAMDRLIRRSLCKKPATMHGSDSDSDSVVTFHI